MFNRFQRVDHFEGPVIYSYIVENSLRRSDSGWVASANSVHSSLLRREAITQQNWTIVYFCSMDDNRRYPTRPMSSWRSAWCSKRYEAAKRCGEIIYPALQLVRCHDLRHIAITTMAEKGLPSSSQLIVPVPLGSGTSTFKVSNRPLKPRH